MSTRPFHKTIVDAIQWCPGPSNGEIFGLFALIRDTTIPEGHDEIIAAIDNYFDFPGSAKYSREIRRVKESILRQKEPSLSKVEGEKGVNLDELKQEAEKLLALLKDPQPGLMAWNGFMQERLQNLQKLTLQALGN